MKFIITALVYLCFVISAHAHGGLEELPKAEIEQIQKTLVKEGYLVMEPGMQYGVYDATTEIAYDAWDDAKLKQKNDEYMKELREKAQQHEAAESEEHAALPWWKKVWVWVKGWF